MKPSHRHQFDIEGLTAFREAYVDMIGATTVVRPAFIAKLAPAVPPEVWAQKRSAVATAAGGAAVAYSRHGGKLTLRNPAVIMYDVDPVVNWEMTLSDPGQLSPETLLSAVDGAVGLASRRAAEAAAREKGVIGLLASFMRWPSELREAVGPSHVGRRRAAGAVGIMAQILVGVIVVVLGAGAVAGIVAAWHQLAG